MENVFLQFCWKCIFVTLTKKYIFVVLTENVFFVISERMHFSGNMLLRLCGIMWFSVLVKKCKFVFFLWQNACSQFWWENAFL